MTRLEKIVASLQHSLGIQKPLRNRAVRRMRARHAAQKKAERQAGAATADAHDLRKKGHVAKAKRKEDKALRLEAVAARQLAKAIVWKGRVRVLTQRIKKIDTSLAAAEKELRELGPKVDYKKQKTVGGTFPERWVASNVASWHRYQEGIRAGRYSQEGLSQLHVPYGPGPWHGRDDCSSYGRSQCLATGVDDPSGHDFGPEGFTGDMAEAHGGWKQVSKAEMMRAGAGFIIYGSGDGHHTEMFAPTKSEPERTIGHGSAPVDPGTIHLFGTGEVERYFIFTQ